MGGHAKTRRPPRLTEAKQGNNIIELNLYKDLFSLRKSNTKQILIANYIKTKQLKVLYLFLS